MKFNFKKIVSWIFLLLWMGVIFNFSRQSGVESGGLSARIVEGMLGIFNINVDNNTFEFLEYVTRKLAHTTEYAILAILLFNALYQHTVNLKKIAITSFVVSALYAITDEAHQLFVTGRGASIKDCLIDSFGAFLGILFCLIIVYTIRKVKNHKKADF